MMSMQNDLSKIAVVSVYEGTGKSFIARNLAFTMKWSYHAALKGKVINWGCRQNTHTGQSRQQLVECSPETLIANLEKEKNFQFVVLILDSNRCAGCDTKHMVSLVDMLQLKGVSHGAIINNHRSGMDKRITMTLERMNVPIIGRIPVVEDKQLSIKVSGEYISDQRTLCVLKAVGRILSAHVKRVLSERI